MYSDVGGVKRPGLVMCRMESNGFAIVATFRGSFIIIRKINEMHEQFD